MPWLPGFDRAVGLPDPSPADPRALAALLVETFAGGVTIDDPDAGRVVGHAAIEAFLSDSARWLGERSAEVRRGPLTVSPARTVGEFDVALDGPAGRFTLPLAMAAERDVATGAVAVRIYHSHWPLLGRHVVRAPLLDRDPGVRESDVVGEYQAALAAGDAERITATFEPDGCFREPAGPQYEVCGTANLLEFFRGFFSLGAGIVLEHCSVTEDGVRTALEFNAVRWGTVDMPHQAGIAVYERGRSGRIASARIYDDVDPPL